MATFEEILRRYIIAYEQGVAHANTHGDEMDIYANSEVLRVLKNIATEAGVGLRTA